MRTRPKRPPGRRPRPPRLGRATHAAALLVLLAGGGVAGAPAEPTEDVRLSPARPPWPRSAPFAAPSDVALPQDPAPLAGTAAGVRVLFASVRGDGVLDAWAPARPGQVHWLPLSRPVVLPVGKEGATEPRELEWRPSSDRRAVASRALPAAEVPWSWPRDWGPVDSSEDTLVRAEASASRGIASRVLARLNDLRMRNGLPPGRLDPQHSADAFLHAAYLAHTGEFGHAQRPGRWASAAGAASGARSGLTKDPDPAANLYQTILHRMIVYRRETTAFGIGAAGGVTVLDGSVAEGELPWSEAGDCIPGPFAEGVPLVARDELPRPHADVVQARRDGVIGGFPITIHVGNRWEGAIPSVEAGLVEVSKSSPHTYDQAHENLRALADEWRSARRRALREGAPAEAAAAVDTAHRRFLDALRALRGRDVPVLVSWPGHPCAAVGADLGNAGAIALLPRSPLNAESVYVWWALWTDLAVRDEDSPGGRPQRMVELFTTGPAGIGVR